MARRLLKSRNKEWIWWLGPILLPLFIASPLLLTWAFTAPGRFSSSFHRFIIFYTKPSLARNETIIALGGLCLLVLIMGIIRTHSSVQVEYMREAAMYDDNIATRTIFTSTKRISPFPISVQFQWPQRTFRVIVFLALFVGVYALWIITHNSDESVSAAEFCILIELFLVWTVNRSKCELVATETGIWQNFRWTSKHIEWHNVRLFLKDSLSSQIRQRTDAGEIETIPSAIYEIASANKNIMLRVIEGAIQRSAFAPNLPEFTEKDMQPLVAAIVHMSGVPLREPLAKAMPTRSR